MKVNEHEAYTEHGGGEQGVIHTLLLHDMHGEYTGDFDKRPENFDGYGECELYWKTAAMQDALQELFNYDADTAETQAKNLMRAMVPIQFIEREGDYIEWIWRLTGSREYLDAKFEELLKTMTVDFVSGDDDAFDYWPNTMDMLFDFASDLDTITDTDERKYQVWEVAKKVFQGTVNAKTWANEDDPEVHGRAVADRYAMFVQEWGLEHAGTSNTWRAWFNKASMRGR